MGFVIGLFVGLAVGLWLGFHPEVIVKLVEKVKR